MAGTYQIWLTDPFGFNRVLVEGWTRLQYARTVNEVGALTLNLPAAGPGTLPAEWFAPDARLLVMRSASGGPLVLETETPWLVRYLRTYTQGAERRYEVRAASALELLARRVVTGATGTAYGTKTAAADDLIKSLCRESLGALVADSARDWSAYLSVQADGAAAPSITKDVAHANLLRACQEVAQASADHDTTPTPLFFDVTQVGGSLSLRTYTGQRGADHTASSGNAAVVLSEERGTLSEPALEYDYAGEVTYVYAGGLGSGAAQLVGSRGDDARTRRSPFGRREAWVSNTNATTLASCSYEAATELRKGRPRVTFAGALLPSADCEYGRDWAWGDRLTASYAGLQLDCRVDTLAVTVEGGAEHVEARLREAV